MTMSAVASPALKVTEAGTLNKPDSSVTFKFTVPASSVLLRLMATENVVAVPFGWVLNLKNTRPLHPPTPQGHSPRHPAYKRLHSAETDLPRPFA